MDGILLINKDSNMTSYDVIKKIKKYYNTSKVGHCGTLDPFATGLLIIGINNGCKILGYLKDDIKEYIATISLGKFYDTYDLDGTIIKQEPIKKFNKEQLLDVLNSFTGKISQVPPIYSAIRVNGRHLYDYARNNEDVEIKSRDVFIYNIDLIDYKEEYITIKVKCSKGTYIRTLGVDIANKLNNLGYLSKLERISVSTYSIKDANTIKDIDNHQLILHDVSEILPFKNINIDESLLKKIYNGQDIILNENDDNILIKYNDKSLAIYSKIDNNIYRCKRGLFDESNRFEK